MTARLSPQREAEIDGRAAELFEYSTSHSAEWDLLAGEDVPALLAELAAVRAELAEAKRASHCQSVAAINGARCALPIRHRGDHQNERRNHYWSDEFAAETEVAS